MASIDDGGDVGEDHAAQVERGESRTPDPFAQATGPGQELEQQRRHHDDVGPDERRADVAEHHGLPQVGVEVLHPGQHGPEQGRADGQLHGGEPAAEGDPEGDADEEDREPGGQAGDGLGAGPGVEDPLEEQDGHVGGRSDARPEQQRPADQHLGVGAGQDVPQLVPGRAGPLRAVGLGPEGGRRRLADQDQHGDAHDHQDDGRPPGRAGSTWTGRLLPRGDDRALDGQAGQRCRAPW